MVCVRLGKLRDRRVSLFPLKGQASSTAARVWGKDAPRQQVHNNNDSLRPHVSPPPLRPSDADVAKKALVTKLALLDSTAYPRLISPRVED